MLWMAVAGLFLIMAGSMLSVLRSSTTVDYYRTMVRDGRDDAAAKRFMAGYYAGIMSLLLGVALVLCSVVSEI